MDSLQFFVTSTKTFSTEYLHMYSGNRYGTKAGSYWPPWVPMEVMYEFEANPYGFSRVVKRTSASLRYDKFNTLRLKYNNDVSKTKQDGSGDPDNPDNRMDHIWIEFPHLRAICDSAQYFAMYIIVFDLLLYSEPLEKTRSERLEKIMLASDFSDLTGAPEMVEMLQARIHQLEEIKMHFQVNAKLLDRQGWKDRIVMDQDLAGCEDELFFMMKAITTSQQRIEDRNMQDTTSGILRWLISAKEVAWHLIREKGESLLEFQLRDSSFDRTDNSDGSSMSCMEVGRMNGFNLLPNAIYPQIIAPYVDEARGFHDPNGNKMLRVHWLMLEAIAGIPVMDYFEIDVVPLHVQLEREVAKKLFEYIFPGVGGSAFEGSGFSPFQVKQMLPTQQEEEEDVTGSYPNTPPSETQGDPQQHQGTGTGAGTLEQRLKPTMQLSHDRQPKQKKQGLGISNAHANPHNWTLFQHANRSRPHVDRRATSATSTKAAPPSSPWRFTRTPSQHSMADSTVVNSTGDSESTNKKTPGGARRSMSSDRRKGDKDKDSKKDKQEPSDDLSQMMNRASNYMTLSLFKVHSIVLCLSYHGRGQRNLEDVHDLVFRLPAFEYRNKTWSNLDLALQMKKDVIRALISHTGAIIGNKFSHHRPNKQQQNRLRELANSNLLMSASNDNFGTNMSEGSYDADRDRDGQSSIKDGSTTMSDTMQDVKDMDGASASISMSDELRPSFTSTREGTPFRNTSATPSTGSLGLTMASAHRNDNQGDNDEGPVAYDNVPATPFHPEPNGTPDRGRTSGSSVSRRLTDFGHRLRRGSDGGGGAMSGHATTNTPNASRDNNDETDDGMRRKSRLLLGGQKLLNRLPRPGPEGR